MTQPKACFNEKCKGYKEKKKYNKSEFDFCPLCGVELEYVCRDSKCYTPLVNVLTRYCDACSVKREESKAQKNEQIGKIAKVVPGLLAATVPFVVKINPVKIDISKILHKK